MDFIERWSFKLTDAYILTDIVVDSTYRGKNLGKRYHHSDTICNSIIEQLKHIGQQKGCYKVLLACLEKNVGFYEKCGLQRKEVSMAYYFQH